MPAEGQQRLAEAPSCDSSASVTPYIPSPTSSEESLSPSPSSDSDIDIVTTVIPGGIYVPPEPSLLDVLVKAAGTDDLSSVTDEVKLQVIAHDVSLQHIGFYLPQLQRLNLHGSVLSSLRDLGCGLTNLKVLRVSRCGLISLDGVYSLQSLEELHAGSNSIADLSPCFSLPRIRCIDLRRNQIKDIASVSFLGLCPKLEHLLLDENEDLVKIPKYRAAIERLLPNIRTLDGVDVTEERSCGTAKSVEVPTRSKHKTSNTPLSVLERTYEVRFAPKVLSPRPSSSSSSDSAITSSYYEHSSKRRNHLSEDDEKG